MKPNSTANMSTTAYSTNWRETNKERKCIRPTVVEVYDDEADERRYANESAKPSSKPSSKLGWKLASIPCMEEGDHITQRA